MCLSCGCHEPYESHGNPANITMDDIDDIQEAASAAGISVQDVAENLAADIERPTELGETTTGTDVSGGVDLQKLQDSGEVVMAPPSEDRGGAR